ncbi:MAG: glycosyltransferase family 39 protein [Chromatiales bacterium]|nr:glycosyltransferase family 39 protein [Chromatiales bacterium]
MTSHAAPTALARPAVAPRDRLRWGWVLLAGLPGAWALAGRPPLPLDETRYLTVAWEMWQRQDWLVPWLNGAPYSHKPPLLFWLIHAGWWLFGVNEWWPRLITPLLAIANAGLAAQLARGLWPESPAVAGIVPWLLAGALGWLVMSQMLLFDMLLTTFVLAAALLLVRRAPAWRAADSLALGALLAGGVLAKGPMVFLQVLLPAACAPLLVPAVRSRWASLAVPWLGSLLLAGIVGLVLAGLWALPAAAAGGPDYAAAILWRQTAGRMVESFAHVRPWWFYGLAVPAMTLPWPLAWVKLRGAAPTPADAGDRLLAGWIASVLAALSLLSGKQPHYALALLVPLALLAARRIAMAGPGVAARVRRMATGSVVVTLAAASIWFRLAGAGFDLRAPAAAVAALQASGTTIAVVGGYHGQLGFLGRLPKAVVPVEPRDTAAWAAAHPGATLLTFGNELPGGFHATLTASFPYRGRELRFYQAGATPEGAATP